MESSMREKGFEVSRLQELARRAETASLSQVSRRRILSSIESDRARSSRWMAPGFAATGFGKALAAAAILVILALPATLYRGPRPGGSTLEKDLNLTARLQDDGKVVLE